MVSEKFVHALRIDVSRYLRSLLSSIRIFMVRIVKISSLTMSFLFREGIEIRDESIGGLDESIGKIYRFAR